MVAILQIIYNNLLNYEIYEQLLTIPAAGSF